MAPVSAELSELVNKVAATIGTSADALVKEDFCDMDAEIVHLRNGIAAYRRSESRMADTMRRLQAHAEERERRAEELERELAQVRRSRIALEAAASVPVAQHKVLAGTDVGQTPLHRPELPKGTGAVDSASLRGTHDAGASLMVMETRLQELQQRLAERDALLAERDAHIAAQAVSIAELELKVQQSRADQESAKETVVGHGSTSSAATASRLGASGGASVAAPATPALATAVSDTTQYSLQHGASVASMAAIAAAVSEVFKNPAFSPPVPSKTSETMPPAGVVLEPLPLLQGAPQSPQVPQPQAPRRFSLPARATDAVHAQAQAPPLPAEGRDLRGLSLRTCSRGGSAMSRTASPVELREAAAGLAVRQPSPGAAPQPPEAHRQQPRVLRGVATPGGLPVPSMPWAPGARAGRAGSPPPSLSRAASPSGSPGPALRQSSLSASAGNMRLSACARALPEQRRSPSPPQRISPMPHVASVPVPWPPGSPHAGGTASAPWPVPLGGYRLHWGSVPTPGLKTRGLMSAPSEARPTAAAPPPEAKAAVCCATPATLGSPCCVDNTGGRQPSPQQRQQQQQQRQWRHQWQQQPEEMPASCADPQQQAARGGSRFVQL